MNENYNAQNIPPQGNPICPHCGAPVRGGETFCGSCGGALRMTYAPARQPADTMTVFDYILSMFLYSIPVVGLILMLYWGFSSTVGINRKNFARAYLVLYVIQVIAVVLITFFFGTIITSVF